MIRSRLLSSPEVRLLFLNTGCALLVGALLVHFVRQREAILNLARCIVAERLDPGSGPPTPRQLGPAIAGWVYNAVEFTQGDPLFFAMPGFRWSGASPLAVVGSGGCCSGKSRLLICLLQAVGVEAYQVTVYHRSGVARHVLVAVPVAEQELLFDPLYGIQYAGQSGKPIGLQDLRDGIPHRYLSLPGSTATGYPPDDYYDFVFRETKTAGWTQSKAHRTAYRVLQWATSGRIDAWPQPWWMEWPQLLLASALLIGCLGANTAHMLLL